ncbi:MAG: GNAT family N-acetyltransferase [Erysipelotrichia bacterium]|nr:GNAT family N-acetyltransferase [Erysipelotrichia bacterium]
MLIKQALAMYQEEDFTGKDMIVRYLNRDPILYAEMLEVYRRGNCDILYEEIDGILLYDHTSHEYLATAKNKAGAKDILLKVPSDYEILIVHDEIFLTLENRDFKFARKKIFYNHIYEKRGMYKIFANNLHFRMLDESYLDTIKETYSARDLCTNDYLLSRIKEGIMGAFIQENLVGFIGMHDNGSIGLMEVFEPYRHKHVGTLLQMMYVNHLLENKYEGILYTQIFAENEISMHLQEKLYFKKASKPSYWYFSK